MTSSTCHERPDRGLSLVESVLVVAVILIVVPLLTT